jgi:hypothetical protein
MQDVESIPREEIEAVVHEIDLLNEAIACDIFYTRDPNDAAMLLCLGMELVKVKFCKQMIYGKRSPQRVVHFGFKGHDETFSFVVRSKLNVQSSLKYKNINAGELRMFQGIVKTILHGMM